MSSGLCGNETPISMTTTELQSPFSNSILPSSVARTSDGLITNESLKTHLSSLQGSGLVPVRPNINTIKGGVMANDPKSPLAEYIKKENDLINKIKAEYCYYESRYKYSLGVLLDSVATASMNPVATAIPGQSKFEVYLPITKALNQKLNDLTQVANSISIERYKLSREDNSNINSINDRLSSRASELQAQAKILASDGSVAELQKRMVEYTNEKNKATSNLLTLYAVLNVVAIGVLVVLARS